MENVTASERRISSHVPDRRSLEASAATREEFWEKSPGTQTRRANLTIRASACHDQHDPRRRH
eukprot:1735946-Amphidinium_carterae.1